MFTLIFANHLKTEDPARIWYTAAVEFLFEVVLISLLLNL